MLEGFKPLFTFEEWKAKVEMDEVTYQPQPDSDWYMFHEMKLTFGYSMPMMLFVDDAKAIIEVLQQAVDRSEERSEQFYSEDEVHSQACV